MTTLLLFLALYLIFRAQIKTFVVENSGAIAKNRENLIKYVASSIVLGVSLSLLPAIVINTYMKANGFFAYEVFQSDQTPFSVLTLNAWGILILLSMTLFGWLPIKAAKANKLPTRIFFLINMSTLCIIFYLTYARGTWQLLASGLIFPLLISLYAAFWIKSKIEQKAKYWYAPLIAAALTLALPLSFQSATADMAGSLLSPLNIGNHKVRVDNLERSLPGKKPDAETIYWLLLRTNEHLYLKHVENGKPSGGPIVVSLQNYAISAVK